MMKARLQMVGSSPISMLVIALCLMTWTESGLVYNHQAGGLTFGNLDPELIRLQNITGYGVLFMELDQHIPGNILFIDSHSLKTLNLDTYETWLIAGDATTRGYREGIRSVARFNAPLSFHQRNRTEVLILDSNNGCIRSVSRVTNETKMFIGLCSVPGNVDGDFNRARLEEPGKVVEISSGILAFTDVGCECIKTINLVTEQVSLLVQLPTDAFGLTKNPNSAELIYSFLGGLGKIDLNTLEVTNLTQTKYTGYRDGPLTESEVNGAIFTVRPETLLFLNENIMLVSGFRTHLVRVVNFASLFVSSICDPSQKGNVTMSGDIETCRIRYPRSLLAVPSLGIVLIGFVNSLGYIEVSGLPESLTYFTDAPAIGTTKSLPATTTRPTTTPTTTTKPITTPKTQPTTSHTSTSTPTTTPATTPAPSPATTTVTQPITSPTTITESTNKVIQQVPQRGDSTPKPYSDNEKTDATVKIIGITVGGVGFIALLIAVVCLGRYCTNRQPSSDYIERPKDQNNEYDYITPYEVARMKGKDSFYETPINEPPIPPLRDHPMSKSQHGDRSGKSVNSMPSDNAPGIPSASSLPSFDPPSVPCNYPPQKSTVTLPVGRTGDHQMVNMTGAGEGSGSEAYTNKAYTEVQVSDYMCMQTSHQ